MNNVMDHQKITSTMLRELRRQCFEVIQAVCERIENDTKVRSTVRRLLQAENMLNEFFEVESDTRDLANLILESSVATMVNSQSLRAIDAEWQKRMVERN